MKTNKEYWRPVPGYEDLYLVSNQGRVRNIKTLCLLKPTTHRDGYKVVRLYRNGKRRNFKAHRLVAAAFRSNSDLGNKLHVHHINGIRDDNHVSNLQWVTPAENNRFRSLRQKRKSKKSSIKRRANIAIQSNITVDCNGNIIIGNSGLELNSLHGQTENDARNN